MFNPNVKSKAGTNYLTEKEEKALFKVLRNQKGKQAERDLALFKLCRLTGLRRGEALALNVGDVRSKSEIFLNNQMAEKGAVGKVYLPVELQGMLVRFLRLKKSWGEDIDDEAPLFISKKGKRLSGRSFVDSMGKWCDLAVIPRFTPHALRHTKAHRILDDTRCLDPDERQKALVFAKEQLRHKSISSTGVYLKPTKEEMEKVAGI